MMNRMKMMKGMKMKMMMGRMMMGRRMLISLIFLNRLMMVRITVSMETLKIRMGKKKMICVLKISKGHMVVKEEARMRAVSMSTRVLLVGLH